MACTPPFVARVRMCARALVAFVAIASNAADAGAQPQKKDTPRAASSENAAVAESLFQEGRKLMVEKRYAEACPKFAASQKVAPAVGTLLNLGDCYERLGKTASAWATYLEAASAAQRSNRADREQTARLRATVVEAKLSRLTIRREHPDKAVPGLVIKRDGVVVEEGAMGAAVPLDPGPHELEASAPGKKTWSGSVDVPPSAKLDVVIPELEDAPLARSLPSGLLDEGPIEEPPPVDTGKTRRVVGIGLVGLGVAGVAAGSIFGLKANSAWSDAQDHCPGNLCHDGDGVSLAEDAKTAGNISTVAFIVGAVALATGAVLILTAPSNRSQPKPVARWGLHGSF